MKVLIYEVKKSANENFKKLYINDYLYWNPDQFRDLSDTDRIFIVNKYYRGDNNKYLNGIVLFCKIENKAITVREGNNIVDETTGLNVTIRGNWGEYFYKFKIIEKRAIDEQEPRWITLGNSETTYLLKNEDYTPAKNTIDNNLQRIEFLKRLFNGNPEINRILDKSKNFLQGLLNNFQHTQQNRSQNLNQGDKKMDEMIEKILIAIKTKPFIILAGLSGTGKSRLVRTLAYKTCPSKLRKGNMPGNFELIPVRPNWHDSSELLGYISRINKEKYVATKFLKFLAKAWKHTDTPFFLLLDEMNLAPVEHYFAEYLSVIETRRKEGDKIVTDFIISKDEIGEDLYNNLLRDLELHKNDCCKEGISIPQNFIVIGTVNMDETTHSFSRKVLDRAMTFEIYDVDLESGLNESINDWDFPSNNKLIFLEEIKSEFTLGSEVWKKEDFHEKEVIIRKLKEINEKLNGTPFIITYRVRDEILIYCYHAKSLYSQGPNGTIWIDKALDDIILMKVLPKIEGDESKTEKAIENLKTYFGCDDNNSNYKKVCKKLEEMETLLKKSGYTSFWK